MFRSIQSLPVLQSLTRFPDGLLPVDRVFTTTIAIAARFSRRTMAVGLLALPCVARGQGELLVGTGVAINEDGRDSRWLVSRDGFSISSGVPMTVDVPGVTPVAGQYRWISANETGDFPQSFSNSYTARTIFTLGAGDHISITMLCAVRDTPLGIWIDDVQVRDGTACSGVNDSGFGPPQTFTDFVARTHTIDLKWSGDQRTDGVIVAMRYVLNAPLPPEIPEPTPPTVVPEPSTWVLMLAGVGMLAMLTRSRRRAA